MASNHEELEELLLEWETGSLDQQGIERLREILRTDEDARHHYLQLQLLDAALKLESDAGLSLPASDAPPTLPMPKKKRVFTSRTVSWIAAAVLLCVLLGRLAYLELFRPSSEPGKSSISGRPSKEPTARGIALVTRLVDVVWEAEQSSFEMGDTLEPGLFAIRSGFAQIEFFCGATVIVEGPARIRLESATVARVESGRLRASVPPAARGFSLKVEDLMVVHLGTELGLSVPPRGTGLQVLEGEVELHADQKKKLKKGIGLFRPGRGKFEKIPVTPEAFLDIAALEARALGQRNARFERWQKWSRKLRHDPRLIAYYALEKGDVSARKLKSSLQPENHEREGAIVGAAVTSGRWPGKIALEFKRPADRVRAQISGEYTSLTFACWVKIDSLDRWYNSLFLTDGYDKGEPHWQILDTGQLFFSVRARGRAEKGRPHKPVLSTPFWNPSMSGKWIHLATTFEAKTGLVVHYLDGKRLNQEVLKRRFVPLKTRFGVSSIGNWASPLKPDVEFAIRNLHGSIGELALFSAALSPREVEEMYQHGKP